MMLFRKQHVSQIVEYSPIAAAFSRSSMDATTREQTKHKFDIAYTIARENLAFAKMNALCKLAERHGVDLGQGYNNDCSCAKFVKFIALGQQEQLTTALSRLSFSVCKPMGALMLVTLKRSCSLYCSLIPTQRMGKYTTIFKAHPTWAASTTKAAMAGMTVEDILQAADWSGKGAFQRFHQPKHATTYGSAVLKTNTSKSHVDMEIEPSEV